MTFDEMNPLQRRLHNAALVLEAEGGDHGFAKLQRDAIDGIAALTKDAARYCFWRDRYHITFPDAVDWTPERVDSATDDAIAAQKEQV